MPADEQKRLERFQILFPPHFEGSASEDTQDFLDRCHQMLCNVGLIDSNNVDFTTFQLGEHLGDGGRHMSWVGQLVQLLLEVYSTHHEGGVEEPYRAPSAGHMLVIEYEARFTELSRRGAVMIPTEA